MTKRHPRTLSIALLGRAMPLAVLLLALASAPAAVYQGDAFTYRQPDGSPFPVRLWGDDFYADEETATGWRIVRDADGWWCYARLAADGRSFVPTVIRVGQGDPATLGIPQRLRLPVGERRRLGRQARLLRGFDERGRPASPAFLAQQAAAAAAAALPGQPAPPSTTTVGTRNGIVIMVRFPDRLADATITQAQVNSYCNGDGYTEFGNNGSVKQYFSDVSNGRLTYTNSVQGYFTAPQNRTYYADTSVAFGTRAEELVVAALDWAQTQGFDFGTVDANGDGFIDGVNVFYAGDVPNSWAQGLWPHMSTGLSWTASNGKRATSYQITNMGTSLTLGTFCHENGHMLCGYPDIYDYDYDSTGGAGVFCLMNSGGHGTNPAKPCAYLRLKAGWLDATDITAASTLTASVSSAGTQIYRFAKDATEYFLIENRQATGRDANLPCSGIAIWHIDEQGDKDNQSFVDNSTHANYECALVQADNQRHFETDANNGDATDLYFTGNTSPSYLGLFNDDCGIAPNWNDAHWWDGTRSGMILSEFSAPGATMTFRVGNGTPPQVTSVTVTPNPMATVVAAGAGTATDDGGETLLTYTWGMVSGPMAPTFTPNGTYAAKNTSITFSRAGTYVLSLTARDAGGLTDTETVTVTVVATLSSLRVTPDGVSVAINGTRTFSVAGLDQFGQAISATFTPTWTVSHVGSSITAAGVLTAGGTVGGPYQVTATVGSLSSSAVFTITDQSPVITAAAILPSPVTGTSAQAQTTIDDDGGASNLVATWTVQSKPLGAADPTISPNGSSAAASATFTFSKAGVYTFLLTVVDGQGRSTSAQVGATVLQTMTSFVVTPSAITVPVGGAVAFAAYRTDQFGEQMSSATGITWSSDQGGVITTDGGYFAGDHVGGPFQVMATDGSVAATAQVTITAPGSGGSSSAGGGGCGSSAALILACASFGLIGLRRRRRG